MHIIDYFACNDQPHWRAAIAENEWRAAKYLARLLEQGSFHDEVGNGTVYLLTEGDRLISFVTLAEHDCVDVPYGPWIGFVHTAPEYRGHRHIGKLIDHACAAAREHGVQRVYLCTDHVGLYEKYGFIYLENRVSIYGEDSRIYVRDTSLWRVERLMKVHLPALFAYERRLSEEEPGFYRWTEETGYQDKVRVSFQDKRYENALSFVAMTEMGEIVGRIDAALIPSHFDGSIKCYLDWICVLKSFRHQGVAQALMAALRTELKGRGIDTLVGLIAANEESQRFYRSVQNAFIRDEGIWIDC